MAKLTPPPPRGVNAHYAIAAVAVTILINRRKDIKLIPGLLARNGGKTSKVREPHAFLALKVTMQFVGLNISKAFEVRIKT